LLNSVTPDSELVVARAACLGAPDLVARGAVGEVQRHQRLEFHAVRQRRQYALAVAERHFGGRHRRLEVRHHDRACETACAIRQHRAQIVAVAQMQMPVVGTCNGDSAHCCSSVNGE